jgi:hypothetical protein
MSHAGSGLDTGQTRSHIDLGDMHVVCHRFYKARKDCCNLSLIEASIDITAALVSIGWQIASVLASRPRYGEQALDRIRNPRVTPHSDVAVLMGEGPMQHFLITQNILV